MEEKEKIAIAQDWVRKLANGINPLLMEMLLRMMMWLIMYIFHVACFM